MLPEQEIQKLELQIQNAERRLKVLSKDQTNGRGGTAIAKSLPEGERSSINVELVAERLPLGLAVAFQD